MKNKIIGFFALVGVVASVTILTAGDFYSELARKKSTDRGYVITGENTDVDSLVEEHVWSTSSAWTALDSARTVYVRSDSIQDNYDSTGAWLFTLYALDSTGIPTTLTDTLNGTDSVDVSTKVSFIYRAKVVKAGSLATNEGTISVYASGTDSLLIQIPKGQAVSKTIQFKVPHRAQAYFKAFEFGATSSNGAKVTFTPAVYNGTTWQELFTKTINTGTETNLVTYEGVNEELIPTGSIITVFVSSDRPNANTYAKVSIITNKK